MTGLRVDECLVGLREFGKYSPHIPGGLSAAAGPCAPYPALFTSRAAAFAMSRAFSRSEQITDAERPASANFWAVSSSLDSLCAAAVTRNLSIAASRSATSKPKPLRGAGNQHLL